MATEEGQLMTKGSDQDIVIEDKSQLEGLAIPVEIYVSAIESGVFVSKDQVKMDENSSPSLKENSHSEDTAEESCTSHSNAHSPDDTMLSNPPKRARHSEGNCCTTTDEGTYVRGRGWGKYICEECGIRCKKPSVLKKHIRTHTNLRPYKCYHCAFAFKTKGNLTKHMKSKAHFKKCIELGVVPVPTTVDDSQIDEEALDKQEKLDKDICPSLNAQEFEDGEEIDDDADESDHSDNEEDDDCNSDTLNLGERIREMKNLKEVDQTHSEKEFAATRDMTEKEGEAAQSLLHLSTCSVSQSSQKKSSVKSLSSGLLSMDHSEDSQSSSVLGSEITVVQSSSCITDFEDALSSPLTSKGMATSPIISSNPHRNSAKLTIGTGFLIADSTPSPGPTFSENRTMERKSGSFENISPLSFRVTSPNSDYRERPQTMWTTTSPQSWHGHSSLSLYPNSHVKYQGKGVIWDGQLLDTGITKPVQFAVDSDQPMDLRVPKTKDRTPEETVRLALYEDWRISQNVGTDHVVRTENPKSNSSTQQDEEVHCSKPEVQNIQEQQVPCLATDNLSPKSVEESNVRPAETSTTSKCQDSKSYAKPTSCHENSIPSYNVGRSEPTFDGNANTQVVQYELSTKPTVDDCVDSESQPTCPISPISPPVGEETVNHIPVMFHDNSATSSHNVSKSDNGTPPRQRECLGKNGALRNSYVSEGKCTCAICNKTFTKPSQLRLHVNIHYFERPFRCDDCAISFRTNGHLEKHKRSASHYNKLHTNTSFGTPCADNPRPFKCSDCNIAFRMHGHLAKHLRSKMHIMKLECLGKLPFGMYAEMERTGVNFNDIDTTDCDNSLESLQEIAQHLYTPPNAQQSMDLTTQSMQTKPKPHFMNSSYSSATPLQIINTSSSCYNSEMQQINPALNLSSFNNCSNDRSRKLNQDKGLLAVNDRAGLECRTTQKEYITEFSHLDASTQPALHSRTCPCDSCISSKITSFSNLGDSCTSRPVKKEQWKLKDRLIAEFQEESTHMENPR